MAQLPAREEPLGRKPKIFTRTVIMNAIRVIFITSFVLSFVSVFVYIHPEVFQRKASPASGPNGEELFSDGTSNATFAWPARLERWTPDSVTFVRNDATRVTLRPTCSTEPERWRRAREGKTVIVGYKWRSRCYEAVVAAQETTIAGKKTEHLDKFLRRENYNRDGCDGFFPCDWPPPPDILDEKTVGEASR